MSSSITQPFTWGVKGRVSLSLNFEYTSSATLASELQIHLSLTPSTEVTGVYTANSTQILMHIQQALYLLNYTPQYGFFLFCFVLRQGLCVPLASLELRM